MRISRDEDKKKKEKKRQEWLEAQIMAILEKSLKTCLDKALDDILRDFKK